MGKKPKPAMKPGALEPGYDPLRDQIAICVMEILVRSDPKDFLACITRSEADKAASFRNVAMISYAMADAMMKERR